MAAAASAAATPGVPRRTAPLFASLEFLIAEYHAYLLRNHDEGLVGTEDLYLKLEASGYEVGKRFTLR